MRYRKLDANNDYTFGQQQASFYINVPEGVAQAVLTRLQLYQGEWFLNTQDGTPWDTKVLGNRTERSRDAAIKARVLGTTGVVSILDYSSNFNPNTRAFTASMTIETTYGITTLTELQLERVWRQMPTPPTGLKITSTTENSISITWT